MSDLRVTQVFAEVLDVGDSDLRVTQVFAEVLSQAKGNLRVTQVFAEVLVPFAPPEPPPPPPLEVEPEDAFQVYDQVEVRRYEHKEVLAVDALRFADDADVRSYGHITVAAQDALRVYDEVEARSYAHVEVEAQDAFLIYDELDSAEAAIRWSRNTIVIMEIRFGDGHTEYLASQAIRHPDRLYRQDVKDWGQIDRSIPAPAGFPRIADWTVEIADTERYWRKLFGVRPAKGAEVLVKMGPVEGRVEQYYTVFRGRVDRDQYPPGSARLTVADAILKPFHEKIPSLITASTFSALPEAIAEVFAPIVYGKVSTEETSGVGALQCTLIDESEGWWLVARHPIHSIRRVLVWRTGDEEYEVVPARQPTTRLRRAYGDFGAAGWFTEQLPVTAAGKTYDCTILRFTTALPEGAQVRVDLWGAVDDDGELIENPVEQARHFLVEWMDMSPDYGNFNLEKWAEASATAEALGYVGGYAYVSQSTHAEALSKLKESFNLDVYADRDGRMAANITASDPDDMPVYDDVMHILRDSFEEERLPDAYSHIRYRYGWIPATGEWYEDDVLPNELAEELLGEEREGGWDLPFVHDADVAGTVTADVAGYLDPMVKKATWRMSAPRVIHEIDLARVVAVHHHEGLSEAGDYETEAQPYKVIGLRLDLNEMLYTVVGISREPPPFLGGGPLEDVSVTIHTNAGPWRYGRPSHFYGAFRYTRFGEDATQRRIRVGYSHRWGRSWLYVDGPTHDNVIGSHTSIRDGRYLHIAAQEEVTGRVSYYRFDLTNQTFEIENETVSALTAISSEYRSGEPVSPTWSGQFNPHVDLIVRRTGEVLLLYTHGERVYDDLSGPHIQWRQPSEGWWWFRQPFFKRRNASGDWVGETRASAPVAGVLTVGQTDKGGALVLDPDDDRVYCFFSPFAWCAPLLSITPIQRPALAVSRISTGNGVALLSKFHNAGMSVGNIDCRFGIFAVEYDDEEGDWIIRVSAAYLDSFYNSFLLALHRNRLTSYATEAVELKMDYVQTANESAGQGGARRSTVRPFTLPGRTGAWATWNRLSYAWEQSRPELLLPHTDYVGTFVGSGSGNPRFDWQSLVFDRGGTVYCGAFSIHNPGGPSGGGDMSHFELWSENEWPIEMALNDFAEEFL
jgi:hypothetical protein